MIGKLILNYRIEKQIGEGGMGSVYLASNINIDHKVAIKVLKPELAQNEGIRKRFEREAATLASLDHQNIVKFINYFEDPEGIYIIMDFIRGQELGDYIQKVSGPIPEETLLPMFSGVLDAFTYAHDKGIVHRDIKPSNIFITEDHKIKILDFGIARIINESGQNLTKLGTRLGTVMYMSPEQVRGKDVDKRSDVYSLGIVLHQMITGMAPYDTTTMSEYDINVKIVEEKLPRAKEFYPFVSEKVQLIIDKALEKDPNKRFQNCDDFKYELTKAIKPEIAVKPAPNQRLKWIAIASIAVILLGCAWIWDYNRLKVRYYANFCEKWGAPEGIQKLSSNEVAHREGSFRFEYRYYKLQRFTRVNSAGKYNPQHDSEHMEEPTDMKLYYTPDGAVDYTEHLDNNGKVLFIKDYSQNLKVITFKHADEFGTEMTLAARTAQQFQDPTGKNSSEKGQISRYLVTYDANGFVTKIQYAKYQNVLVGDKDGIYGREYVNDAKGRKIEEKYISFNGQVKNSKKGLAIRKHKFDENDLWVQTSYFDANGNYAKDETGIPIVNLYYDKYGNRIKEEYVDSENKLINRTDTKSAGFVYQFDENGFMTEMMYINIEGKIAVGTNGIAGSIREFDKNGYVIKYTTVDIDRKPAYENNSGYTAYTTKYDEYGNTLEQWYLNEKQDITLINFGIAGYSNKYDSRGNLVEQVYYGLDRKPIISSQGTAGFRYEYNDFDKVIKSTNLGVELTPIADKNGIYIWRNLYDKTGNWIAASYYNETGRKLIHNNENIAGWRATYDEQGNQIEFVTFNADSALTNGLNGYARYVSKYDAQGNKIEQIYYNANSSLSESKGYASWKKQFDERGNETELYHYDKEGKISKNYLITKNKYDASDNLIEVFYYDLKENLVLNKDNYAGYKCQYDKKNQEIKRTYFGINNQPAKFKDNYAIITYLYDSKGNIIEWCYFDEKEQPCIYADGPVKYAKIKAEYNNQGKTIGDQRYDIDGQPISGVFATKRKYDAWGNQIEIAAYDKSGNLIMVGGKWAIRRAKYDINENQLMIAFYDASDKPCVNEDYFKKENIYNRNNKVIEERFYDADQNLRRKKYAIEKTSYNNSGNITEIGYFNGDNVACNYSPEIPFHKLKNLYNESGNLTYKKYYSLSGSLIATFDAKGNRI